MRSLKIKGRVSTPATKLAHCTPKVNPAAARPMLSVCSKPDAVGAAVAVRDADLVAVATLDADLVAAVTLDADLAEAVTLAAVAGGTVAADSQAETVRAAGIGATAVVGTDGISTVAPGAGSDGQGVGCPFDASIQGAFVTEQYSDASCILNQSWGVNQYGLWASNGCKAQFEVYYR
ncbi:MAG: DUF3011 domain-containing protein [Proteobacteria bacterium]|nr:DUF3011 domain-containing protein [Pseudomonadota bacterium]